MAATNVIRVRTSVDILQDVGGSAGAQEGITYTQLQHDGNADYRTWGGKYDTLTAYTDADVCYWKNAVVSQEAASNALNASAWTEETAVTDGTIPTTAYIVAVEYVSELGSVGYVYVKLSGEVFAKLDLGESVVIPMHYGEAPSDIFVYADNYTDTTTEATVNIMMAGV